MTDCGIVEIKEYNIKNGEFAEYPDTYTKRDKKQIKYLIKLRGYIVFVLGIPGVK